MPLSRPPAGAVEAGLATISKPNVRRPRRRMFRRLEHCSVPGFAPLCLDSNDPDTVDCAFRQRLLRSVPKAEPNKIEALARFVKKFLLENVPRAQSLSFEEWLDATTYSEARKAQIRDAHNNNRGGRPMRKQCMHVDSFVKTEYYPTWKHARIINSRHDAFKAWSGPRFKAIENVLYQLPEFVKHVPVPERPARVLSLKQAGQRYYQTDFTAFESHFTPELLDAVECQLYRHCLINDKDAEFLCSVIKGRNDMRTRTSIRASVVGRRMSGDMCTSLGNGFTNLMLAKFIAYSKGGDITGLVEGDDGLFSTNVSLTKADYEELGFTIKIQEVHDPCEASFCGMIFSESGQIIRDPIKFVMGFGWTQSFINAGTKIMDELLRAKALSCVYETPHCPIVGAMARYALQKTKGANPRFVRDGFHEPPDIAKLPAFAPSSDTRELFEHQFGIAVGEQLIIEDLIGKGNFSAVGSLLKPTTAQYEYTLNYVEVT